MHFNEFIIWFNFIYLTINIIFNLKKNPPVLDYSIGFLWSCYAAAAVFDILSHCK